MSGEHINGVMYGLESDLEKYPEPGEPNRAIDPETVTARLRWRSNGPGSMTLEVQSNG